MKGRILPILLWVSFFAFNVILNAQNVPEPELFYKSPEVIGFEKRGCYDVGEYSGTVSISVPLYTLTYKDIELPLAISYDSRGVKVDSEASWIGLNWDLNVGGCVSLVPNGGVDWRQNLDYRNYYNNVLNIDGMPDNSYNLSTAEIPEGLVNEAASGHTELDFYSVSLPGHSLFFFVDPDTNLPVIIGPERGSFSIVADMNGTLNSEGKTNDILGWTIKDGDGYIYDLTIKEKSNSRIGTMYNTAWYLSKITSPLGNTMSFQYTTPQTIHCIPKLYETFDIELSRSFLTTAFGSGNNYFGYNDSFSSDHNTLKKPYLSRIETKDHDILFMVSSRDDMNGASKLDSITVKSKLTGKTIRRIKFGHSYFSANNIGGNYISGRYNISNSYMSKRLKLDSVSFYAYNESVQTYLFDYEESKGFPLKTSVAVDMFGYYNGRENYIDGRRTMIPSPMYCDIDSVYWNMFLLNEQDGANRFTNTQLIDALILKKITYPTKGYTTFQFESNTFRKYYKNKIASGKYSLDMVSISVDDINYNGAYGGPIDHREILLDDTYKGTLNVKFTANNNLTDLAPGNNCYVSLFRIGGPGIDRNPEYTVYLSPTEQNLYNLNYLEKNVYVELPAGRYMFIAQLPNSVGSGKGQVSGRLDASTSLESGVVETNGGGLRINRINNYDSDGNLLEYSEYGYSKADGSSSGLLINPLGFDRRKIKKEVYANTSPLGSTYSYNEITFDILSISNNANKMTSFASAMSSTDVAYSRVTKTTHTKAGARKEISNYHNEINNCNIQDLCSVIATNNGNLEKKEYLDENGNTLRKEEYIFSTTSAKYKKSFSIEDRYVFAGNSTSMLRNDSGFSDRFKVICHSFTRYWNRLQSLKVTDYVNGVPKIANMTTYDYEPSNYQVSSITKNVVGSNEQHKTEIIYTSSDQSRLNPSSSTMVQSHNIMNAVVQKKEIIASTTIKTQRYQYSTFGNKYRLANVREYIGSDTIGNRVEYQYSDSGNVKYIVKDAIDKVVYLWSYKGCYPVAKIEGLSFSEVSSVLTQSFVNSLEAKVQPTSNDIKKIRDDLSAAGALVSTFEYDPLVGLKSQTSPSGIVMQYVYDGFGRLIKTVDVNGHTVSSNKYHYK